MNVLGIRNIFLLENRNYQSRVRDRKRKTYTEFLQWCENHPGLPAYTYPEDKAQWLPRLFEWFAPFKEACAWAWTLFGAPLPRGLATQGAGGSLVSQPGQPGLWALEHALLSLQAALPVQLTLDCTSVQSGIELGPVRRRTKMNYRPPDAFASRWRFPASMSTASLAAWLPPTADTLSTGFELSLGSGRTGPT